MNDHCLVCKNKTCFAVCVRVCREWRGTVKGSDLQVHPKLPQTGSGGWTSLERCRGGEGEGEREKTEGAREGSVWHNLFLSFLHSATV